MKRLFKTLLAIVIVIAVIIISSVAIVSVRMSGQVKALQIGDASKVVPIDKLSVVITLVLAFVFLHEDFTIKSLAGCALIGAGTLLLVL